MGFIVLSFSSAATDMDPAVFVDMLICIIAHGDAVPR